MSSEPITLPTDEQALQFVIMLQAGLPAAQAILYFIDSDDRGELVQIVARWQRARAVRQAQAKLMSKPWQEMTTDERCKLSLEQHYNALAYLLYSTHYAEAGPTEKAKLDSARQAIEAKLAGTAGKMDAIGQFVEDLRLGKLKLPSIPVPAPKTN